MTVRLEPIEVAARGSFLLAACVIGLVAGLDPVMALLAAAGAAFLLLTVADLRIGLVLFTAVSFFEMFAVAQDVGLAKVAGLAVAISWLARILTRPDAREFIWESFPLLFWTLAAFLGWAILSTAWAFDSAESLNTVYRYVLNAALFPIVYTAVRQMTEVTLILGAFLAGAVVAASYGLITNPAVGSGIDLQRVAGTIGDPNALAAALVAGLVIALALAASAPRAPLTRIVAITSGLFCLLAVVFTASRGGFVALASTALVAPLVVKRNRGQVIALVICLSIAFIGYVAAFAPPGTIERFTERDGGTGRTDIWKVGFRMVNDKPILGVGTGNFKASAPSYTVQAGSLPNQSPVAEPHVAHNVYLEILAELGAIGLALFLSLVLGCLALAFKASRRFLSHGMKSEFAIAIGVLLALIAILTTDIFLSNQYSKQLWLLLALCPPIYALAPEPGPSLRASNSS